MTNFQEIRKEIEKGCGKKLQYTHGDGTVHWKCGETETYNWMYCEVCQAKLEILNKCEEIFNKSGYRRGFIAGYKECEEIFKEMIFNICDFERINRKYALLDRQEDTLIIEDIRKELLSQFNSPLTNAEHDSGSRLDGDTSQLKQEKEEKQDDILSHPKGWSI